MGEPDDVIMGELAPHLWQDGNLAVGLQVGESWPCPSTDAQVKRAFFAVCLGSTVGLVMDVRVVDELALKM